ncbi:uncharacterized protein LOC118416983 isoform X1 [Branchiostoma floridae]|uniref:Uncharacterized protein LOC118416983 isoform X1 n=2 Tax=Branchiostoma floridae TaxID=7739 RepID=A0A9J7MSI0_BRAFL|nr:uncharacterized protein LOC118416983 isoform X1 [Branchiostoma floridae]
MPVLCAVYGCGNNSQRDKEYSFFRIPKIIENQGEKTRVLSEERRTQWLANINRADLNEQKCSYSRVCSKHFVSRKPADLYACTDPDWVPTQHLGHNKVRALDISIGLARNDRLSARNSIKRRKIEEEDHSTNVIDPPCPPVSPDEPTKCDVGCQTDMTGEEIDRMKFTVNYLSEQQDQLKTQLLAHQLHEGSFSNGGDDKVRFFTGLPNFLILMNVFQLVVSHVKCTSRNVISPFQQFILVLMRLRLALSLQDLSYRFGISLSTTCRIFDKWISVMNNRLSFLILWPQRDVLRKTMPTVFKQNFGNKVSVIIDCFEVFIERPSSLIARAMTWSTYKHHNTVKFLIGISPQGCISFISKAWGGRVSDKYLTENCGILRKLEPGDIVLADRGFTIADSVAFQGAKLHIPAFTKGKKQLSASEVETTRKIANVRIHVERVIGLVRRKYSVLQSTLPIPLVKSKPGDALAPIDKITRVCCALTNLSDSVVPS